MLGVFSQPAFASITNLQHNSFTEVRVGQLDATDKRDGYWFFVSGAKSSLEIKAQSRNGANIGTMGVYSHTGKTWLLGATATGTVHAFTGEVGSG